MPLSPSSQRSRQRRISARVVPGWAMAAALAAYPCYRLARNLRAGGNWAASLWYLSALAGALVAAYALRNFHRANLRHLWVCLGTAGVIGIIIMVLSIMVPGVLSFGMAHHRTFAARASGGLVFMLLYVPVVFMLQEVAFRGAFDAYVYHPGEGRGVLTAVVVSAFWGLWQVPLVLGRGHLWMLIPGLLAVLCVLGLPLSIAWRRSGNLFVPGVTHTLIDTVRDALLI